MRIRDVCHRCVNQQAGIQQITPKQWVIVHASDLMMIIKQSIYDLNHHKGNGQTYNTHPHILSNGKLNEYA